MLLSLVCCGNRRHRCNSIDFHWTIVDDLLHGLYCHFHEQDNEWSTYNTSRPCMTCYSARVLEWAFSCFRSHHPGIVTLYSISFRLWCPLCKASVLQVYTSVSSRRVPCSRLACCPQNCASSSAPSLITREHDGAQGNSNALMKLRLGYTLHFLWYNTTISTNSLTNCSNTPAVKAISSLTF